jgi:hypothetical protein
MDTNLTNVREKLHLINNKLDEIHMLMCEMSDDTNGALDLLDERNSLRDWETALRERYNEYATNEHLKTN